MKFTVQGQIYYLKLTDRLELEFFPGECLALRIRNSDTNALVRTFVVEDCLNTPVTIEYDYEDDGLV